MILGTKLLTDEMIVEFAHYWTISSRPLYRCGEKRKLETTIKTSYIIRSARNRGYDLRLFRNKSSGTFYNLVCQDCGKQFPIDQLVWQLRHENKNHKGQV